MSFTEKIDTLDLLINVLQEHEKTLDEKIHKFEVIVERIESALK